MKRVITLLFLLAACAPIDQFTKTTIVDIGNYMLGVRQSANVGEPVFRRDDMIERYCIRDTKEYLCDVEKLPSRELIFSGITGNQINLSYREYTADGMARPAFFQDLTYPRDSKILTFQNIEIEIYSVSSATINYAVIKD
jgi:hypothetical protein